MTLRHNTCSAWKCGAEASSHHARGSLWRFGRVGLWPGLPTGKPKAAETCIYASSCATGRISRLLLADVSGHGNAVAGTASDFRTPVNRRFVNRLDQTEFVRLLPTSSSARSPRPAFTLPPVDGRDLFRAVATADGSATPAIRDLCSIAQQRKWDFLGGGQGDSSNLPIGLLEVAEDANSSMWSRSPAIAC